MTRSLTAGVIAEIATNKLNPVELVYLGISTGTYYTDHYKDLIFDGNTYTASSLFLGSSEVQETADVAVNTLLVVFTITCIVLVKLFNVPFDKIIFGSDPVIVTTACPFPTVSVSPV